MSEKGLQLLHQIAAGYRHLLNELAIHHPTLPTICYAYDYPRPAFKDGKYLGQHLKRLGYPIGTWDSVAKVIIDSLSDVVADVVASFPNVRFLDCRGRTAKCPFYDDMHPEKEGFAALAAHYEQAIGVSGTRAVEIGYGPVKHRGSTPTRRRVTRRAKRGAKPRSGRPKRVMRRRRR